MMNQDFPFIVCIRLGKTVFSKISWVSDKLTGGLGKFATTLLPDIFKDYFKQNSNSGNPT